MNIFVKFVGLREKISQNNYYKRLETIYNKPIDIRNHENSRNYY